MTFEHERTDDYDSDNYLDHAEEFETETVPLDWGGDEPYPGAHEGYTGEKITTGEWHNVEYTVAPDEKPTLKVDGEEVGEIESVDWEGVSTSAEDNRLDATRMAVADELSGSFTINHDPHICQNCGWQIGPLEYEMVHDEKTHEVNYCSGCGKPVEEVLDL